MKTLFLCFLSFLAATAFAQQTIPTKGKEFWLGFMNNASVSPSDTLQLFISSDVNTSGIVEVPLQAWSQNFTVTANVTTGIVIPNNIAEHFLSETVEQRGVHVLTQDTVSVFAINFQSFTADGSKIFPKHSLGTNYMVSTYFGLAGIYSSEFLVVATEDNTEVEITPTADCQNGAPANIPFTVQLDEGESYQVIAAQGSDDLTGSTVVATDSSGPCRPFAVFSGSQCTYLPAACQACDHIFDQNIPSENWGEKFYLVPFNNTSSYTYRILARDNNTSVSVNGGPQFNMNAGQVQEYNYEANDVCVIADKPVQVTQYMQGVTCTGAGDPAMLILNAEKQKIDDVTFSTVASPVLTNHSINIIIESSEVNTLTLDGSPVAANLFTPFAACPNHSYANFTISAGSHTLQSPAGYTAYVYGTGSAESYAYSVGAFDPLALNIDTVFCTNDTVTLIAPNGFFNYWWAAASSPNDTIGTGQIHYIFPPISNEIYIVTAYSNLSGCEIQSYYSVESPDSLILDVTAMPDTICAFQEVQLNVDVLPPGSYVYSWTPTNSLDNPAISNPIATPGGSTWYVVTVSTASGCAIATDSVFVYVTPGNFMNFNATPALSSYCAPDSVQLSLGMEEIFLNDDFDPQQYAPFWQTITNGTANTDCGSVLGNAMYFDGNGTREIVTVPMDVSNGGTVQFWLKVGWGAAPCEDADPGEDIVLEYSTGGPWNNINTYFEALYPVFTLISAPIPPAAWSPTTQFRWRQVSNSGAGQDNWALDDIVISSVGPPPFPITWTPAAWLDNPNIPNPWASPDTSITYTITMIDSITGCVYVDSVYIDVGEYFTLAMPSDTTVCDTITGIMLDAAPTAPGNYTWTWAPTTGLSNPFIQNPIATNGTTITYYVTVTSDQGCTVVDSITVTVNQLGTLTLSASPVSICEGDSVLLNVIPPAGGNYSYSWSPAGNVFSPNSQSTMAAPIGNTWYVVTVIDTVLGCALTDSILATVIPGFPVTASNDTFVCTSVGYTLDVTHGASGPVTYSWSPGGILNNSSIQSPIIQVDTTMVFYVIVTDANGCSYIDSVSIGQAVYDVELGDSQQACQPVTLTANSDGPYEWNTGETSKSIVAETTGNYWVIVGMPGCEAFDSIYVDILETTPEVIIPNVFTPNKDAYNDEMELILNYVESFSFVIYNRWGQELFTTDRMDSFWDGTNNGKKAAEGVYYWVITYQPQCDPLNDITLTGTVQLLR